MKFGAGYFFLVDLPCTWGTFGSVPGLYSLDVSSNPTLIPQLWQPKMSLDVANVPYEQGLPYLGITALSMQRAPKLLTDPETCHVFHLVHDAETTSRENPSPCLL